MPCQDSRHIELSLCLYKSEADLPIQISSFICQSCGSHSSQSSSTWPRVLQHALWCRCSIESKCWITFCWLVFHHLTRWSRSMETTWTTHTANTNDNDTQTCLCMMMKSCSVFFCLYLIWFCKISDVAYRMWAHNYFMEVRWMERKLTEIPKKSFIWSQNSSEAFFIIQRLKF